jgi:AcrR family transcriptional regulator
MMVMEAARSASSEKKRVRKPRDAAATRQRILDAAIGEFAANGFSGARIENIARLAKSNIRMIYHHFGSKDGLYVEVLEHVLDQLREDELGLDFEHVSPREGVHKIFDFIHGHFASHPELMSLLSSENLNKAEFLQRSSRIPERASPVIAALNGMLRRGAEQGVFRSDVDALHLYITIVSLAYFHRSNAHTLSQIFRHDLLDPIWQQQHQDQARDMVFRFLEPPARQG